MKGICPECGQHLTDGGVPHCDPRHRETRCGWIKHRPCGAVVDPRRGRFVPGAKG